MTRSNNKVAAMPASHHLARCSISALPISRREPGSLGSTATPGAATTGDGATSATPGTSADVASLRMASNVVPSEAGLGPVTSCVDGTRLPGAALADVMTRSNSARPDTATGPFETIGVDAATAAFDPDVLAPRRAGDAPDGCVTSVGSACAAPSCFETASVAEPPGTGMGQRAHAASSSIAAAERHLRRARARTACDARELLFPSMPLPRRRAIRVRSDVRKRLHLPAAWRSRSGTRGRGRC